MQSGRELRPGGLFAIASFRFLSTPPSVSRKLIKLLENYRQTTLFLSLRQSRVCCTWRYGFTMLARRLHSIFNTGNVFS